MLDNFLFPQRNANHSKEVLSFLPFFICKLEPKKHWLFREYIIECPFNFNLFTSQELAIALGNWFSMSKSILFDVQIHLPTSKLRFSMSKSIAFDIKIHSSTSKLRISMSKSMIFDDKVHLSTSKSRFSMSKSTSFDVKVHSFRRPNPS